MASCRTIVDYFPELYRLPIIPTALVLVKPGVPVPSSPLVLAIVSTTPTSVHNAPCQNELSRRSVSRKACVRAVEPASASHPNITRSMVTMLGTDRTTPRAMGKPLSAPSREED